MLAKSTPSNNQSQHIIHAVLLLNVDKDKNKIYIVLYIKYYAWIVGNRFQENFT